MQIPTPMLTTLSKQTSRTNEAEDEICDVEMEISNSLIDDDDNNEEPLNSNPDNSENIEAHYNFHHSRINITCGT